MKIFDFLNKISLKRKMVVIQIICVFIPLLVTDSYVVGILVRAERAEDMRLMKNVSDSVEYILDDYIGTATSLMTKVKVNKAVSDFTLNTYSTPIDYYIRRFELIRDALFTSDRCIVTIYSNTEGLINGGTFQSIVKAEETDWYSEFIEKDVEDYLYVDYTKVAWETKRVFSIVSWFDHFNLDKKKDLVKVDINYSDLAAAISNAKYSSVVYVCDGDRIVFSNDGKEGLYRPFEIMTREKKKQVGYAVSHSVYNKNFDIYVLNSDNVILKTIKDHGLLISLLALINLLLPTVVMQFINHSLTKRIMKLKYTMEGNNENQMSLIDDINGTDEISDLMSSYNRMAKRINDLIDKEYLEKIKQQQSNIARQKAELLALHSQINPHFLFNALESIRMHSVIKHETETARMVEKLAIMQRQNVEWGSDYVRVSDEIRFVEAYLELQKYRFGNRLLYEINVDEDCNDLHVPKISLVTFVENACVHGMEKKTSSCWIFVRVLKAYGYLVMEIEDTGLGVIEENREKLLEDMYNITLEELQTRSHVGILNAALRLRMFTNNRVIFEIESEKGAGTMITIKVPLDSEGANSDAEAQGAFGR